GGGNGGARGGRGGPVSSQVAETDPALLDAAELHVADLVGRDHDLPVLVVREDEQPAIGQGLGQGALDLLRGRLRLKHELPGDRLDPDLYFHGAPLGAKSRAPASRGRASAAPPSPPRAQPLTPRHASRAMSCSAASLGISWSVLSQKVALAWAMPTSPIPSRC